MTTAILTVIAEMNANPGLTIWATPNDEYRAVYEDHHDALRADSKAACLAAEAEWAVALAAERKRLKLKKKENPPAEFTDDLRARLMAAHRIAEYNALLDAAIEARTTRLYELAKVVTFTPSSDAWFRVQTASSGTYRSQGWGADTYAKGRLLPLENKLTSLGFSTHVRHLRDAYSDWELWADCPEWMGDAASRLVTNAEWLACYARHGINARVYNPFLPYDNC